MSIRKSVTAHISPYVGGLAPESNDFLRYLNKEAQRLRSGVSFIALANRILAHGNLERALKFANSVGAWLLRRALDDGFLAHRPQRITLPTGPITWDKPTIEGEEIVLRRGNSEHRRKLRRFEKNNLPFKCDCAVCGARFECRSIKEYAERRGICWGCGFENKIKIAAETLYHLICAIPQTERDRQEIYPGDFRCPVSVWREEDKEGLPGLGLRDYAQPTRLLTKFGRYEFAWRQKAASAVRPVALDASYVAMLVPTEIQRALERAGRLYKNSRWWSKAERTLFDKCEVSSAKVQSWLEHRVNRDAIAEEVAADWRQKAAGGKVLILGSPAKRYRSLESGRTAYNEKHGSYLNSRGLSKTLRERRSLNIDPILIPELARGNEQAARYECKQGKRYG
jgi:hypothetical protein